MFSFPVLEINLSKLLINSVVLRFDVSSKYTALLTLQENNKVYALRSFLLLNFKYTGSIYWVPTISNGKACSVLSLGKSPGLGFG